MSALSVEVPFPVFYDRSGEPLENGYVWIGQANLNPQTNPIQVYFDKNLTQPAAQPLRTLAGYISNAGTPAQVYVDAVNYSILVQDKNGTMVYNFQDGTGISPDACGVEYNPPFTNSVPLPVCVKLAETVSVKDFGAVGDGVTNDTAAFQSAFNYCASTGDALKIPAGTYILSDVISATGFQNVFSIYGDGKGSTKLVWTSAGGIVLDYSSGANYRSTFGGQYKDFCLFSRVLTGAGTAFSFIAPPVGAGSTSGVSFENLYIDNDVTTNNINFYWNNGISIKNSHSSAIISCDIYGNRTLASVNYLGSGIIIDEDCTEGPQIIDCSVGSWNKAVELKASPNTAGTEGTRIISCTLVANGYGVYADMSSVINAGNPGINITNNHISSTLANCYLLGPNQLHISENLFYIRSNTTATTFYGVYLDNCISGVICENIFSYSVLVPNSYGVYLSGGRGFTIDGNLIQSSNIAVGAYFSPTTSRVVFGASNYFNQAIVGIINDIPLRSNFKIIGSNAPGFSRINFLTQSIPDNVLQVINLNGSVTSSVQVVQVYNSTNPTRLVIPPNVNRVVLTAGVVFDTNSAGYRRVDIIDKNSNPIATTSLNPVSGISTFVTLISQVIEVTSGDYFELRVTQTSGSPLNAVGGLRSFLETTYIS
jgi:hypothetical protein